MSQITKCGGNLELFGDWIWHRRCELSLFQFLQRATSLAKENASEWNTQDQIQFIHSLLFIIIYGFSMQGGISYEAVSISTQIST